MRDSGPLLFVTTPLDYSWSAHVAGADSYGADAERRETNGCASGIQLHQVGPGRRPGYCVRARGNRESEFAMPPSTISPCGASATACPELEDDEPRSSENGTEPCGSSFAKNVRVLDGPEGGEASSRPGVTGKSGEAQSR
jgi:hypothetical protein